MHKITGEKENKNEHKGLVVGASIVLLSAS